MPDAKRLDGAPPLIQRRATGAVGGDAVVTGDSDSDGRIDQVVVEFTEIMPSGTDVYIGGVTIEGFTISAASRTPAVTDEVVYTLAVATGDPPNTEAVPDFLYNSATGAILDPAGLELVDIGSADVTEVDGAGPVLVSAEGRVESRELFVRFSEPVLGTGTGSDLIAADFFYQNNFNASVNATGIDSVDSEGAATNGADESVIIYVNENFHIQDIGSDAISFAPSVAGSNLSLVTDNVFNRAAVILVMISPPKLLVTSINPTSGTALGGTPVTIRGNDFQSEATVTFRDSAATNVIVVSDTIITAATPSHPIGSVDVIVTNPSGLADTLFNGFTFLSHPDVTSIDPVSGTELGGTSVTISGSSFQSGSTVTLGDSAATDIVVISSDTITAVTPAHPAGTVDVIVTNPSGLADTLFNGFTFLSYPDVTSIDPVSGTELGGTSVTISGSSFQSGSTVTLGDSAATDIVVISSDTITAVTPAHLAGTVDVIVTNPNGLSDTLSNGFTFLSHPAITSIDTVLGTQLGGTSVTISGSSFQSGSTVTLGDSAATDIVVISSDTITAVTPAHPAGTVDVIVTNPNGLSDTLSNGFTFLSHPAITSIDPVLGTQLGGTSVTITGSDYRSGSTVTFGDSAAIDIVVISSGTITAVTPAHPAGTVDVIVTNPNGLSDTLSSGLTFLSHPDVTSIDPVSGTELGGTSVTISGSSFQSGSTVTFGNSVATDVFELSESIINATTPAHPAGTVDVIVTNPSGLADTLSGGFTFLSHPDVTSIDPVSGTELGGTSVTIVGSNFQSGSTVTFGDSTATDIVVISSGTITAVTPAHPAGTVDVIVTNPNGLSDTLSNRFEFIGIPPVVTSIDPNSGTQLGSTSVTISGNSFQSGSTVTFGDSTATDIVVVSSAIVTAKTSSYPAGTVDVIVTNPNGLADTLSNGFIFIPPLVVTSINPNSDTQLGGTSVTISGSDFQSGSTVTFGDSTATDIVVISSGTITAVTPAHPAGTVDVIVTNPSGLSDTLSSGLTFLSHPDVTFINPSSGTELGGTSVTIVGSNFQSGSTVTFGDSTATDIVVISSGTITAVTPAHPAGTVDVIVTNPNGLSDTLSNRFEFIGIPPVVTSIDPNSGTQLGSTSVTISGNSFQSGSTVTFGDSTATDIVVVSSAIVTAKTSSYPAGTVDVIVTNPNGLADTLSNGFIFIPPLVVTSINPNSDTQLGGTSVTISGSDFQSGSTVTFGDSTATDIVVISSGTITAVTPAHPAGTVDVIVTNPSGLSDTLSSGLTFLSHPEVTFINPSSGTELGGTSVTIVGSNFQSGSTVTFGDSTATDIVVISSGTITAVTPAHPAGTVDVIVTNPNGLSDTLSNRFEFIGIPPVVTSIDPNSGTQLGSTSVTISGNSFQSGSTVTFGDSTATDIVVVSSATVTAKTSSYPAGTVDVIVTNPNGLADTLSNGFIFIPPLVVTSINPNSDTQLGGTSVTISGSDFQSGSTVTFGDSTATDIVVISSGTITAVTPAHPAGTVDVIVTNPSGLSDTLSSGLTFLSHPEVTFINPSSGTELGGTSVTIVGGNFQSGLTVTFGDSSATDIVVVSSTIITAKTSLYPAGTVDVIVTNPSGLSDTLSNGFIFLSHPVPTIAVSPTAIDFDTVKIGNLASDTLIVINTGTVSLRLDSLVVSGNPVFSSPSGPFSIAPGESLEVEVTFIPDTAKIFSDTLTIFSNSNNDSSLDMSLTGTGGGFPAIDAVPDTLNFGDIVVNTSKTDTVVVKSVGSILALEIDSVVVTSGDSVYSIVGIVGIGDSIIAFGDSFKISVEYSPKDVGSDEGTLTIFSNALRVPAVSVVLLGSAEGFANIDVDPDTLDFGNLRFGLSKRDTVGIISVGVGTSLVIDSLVVTEGTTFVLIDTVGNTFLLVGDTLFAVIEYTPDGMDTNRAKLNIFSNTINNLVLGVPLEGKGIAPYIDASTLAIEFDSVEVGNTSEGLVVIRNSGDAGLTLGILTVDDVVNYAFNLPLVSVSDSVIAPGDSITVVVTFQPEERGTFPAILTIPSNDPDALQDTVFVNLTGVGIAPVNEVSRSLIDFLGMPKDSVKVDSVFVKNVGDTPAKILSVEIGTSIFTPSFGDSVINPSDSVRVDVAFRPPSAGLFEDTLIVVNGIPSSSETLKVALVGRGILINVLAVGDAQAFAGDMDVEVSLSILNNDTLRGVEFDLIFDADSLTLVDVKPRFGLAASLTPPYGVILDIPQGTNLVPIHQDLDTLAVLVFDVDAGVPAGIVGLDLENVKFTGASGDTLTPDSVALDGSIEILFGMNIDVGPDTMVFAESPPNDTSFAALRVFNVGNRDSLIVAQIISSNPSVFSVVDPLPSSPILKVDSLDITLRFTSPDTGFFTATATIVSNDLDADSVFVVNLTGVGKIAGFNISSSVKYFADTTKNVPDVVIRLAELPDQTFVDSDTAITDGSYDLLLVPAGKGYRATPLRAETEGAATGAITINDPVFLLQKLGGIRSFNRQDTLAADVDGDLVPTINDAVFLLQKLGGIRSLVKQLCPRQRLKRRLWVKE